MKQNNTLPTRTFLQQLIPQLMGPMVNYVPGIFISFDDILDAVIDHLGIDKKNPPYRIGGERPNLRRLVYVSAWNLAVERREGYFWLVRVDPDSDKEMRVSESAGGKGRAGNATRGKAKGYLWGMTWYGIKRSLESNGVTERNLTSLWMADHYDNTLRNKTVAAVAKRCSLSTKMDLQEEHAQEYATKLLERDGLKGQLTAHQGYGRPIRPSEIGLWATRDAFSQMRGWGKDGHLRAMRGATTETERRKAAEQDGDTLSVGYQRGVSPIVMDMGEDSPMVKDFTDQSSPSPDIEEEFKDLLMHYEIMIERKLRDKQPERYIQTMYMLYSDHSQREIATALGVSSTTVSNMIKTLQYLFTNDSATR